MKGYNPGFRLGPNINLIGLIAAVLLVFHFETSRISVSAIPISQSAAYKGATSSNVNAEVFLRIARDFRESSSLSRAARFYEFSIEQSFQSADETGVKHTWDIPAGKKNHIDKHTTPTNEKTNTNTNMNTGSRDRDTSDLAAREAAEAALLNNRKEAFYELAQLLERDPTLSANYTYLESWMHAAELGHPEAQHKVSVMYSTGIAARHLVPTDGTRGLLLEYMAALAGYPLANMGMGYRYLHGIGVPESCESALPFYELAANHAAEVIQRTGFAPSPDRLKLTEAVDPHAKWLKRDGTQELTDYYAHLADSGDAVAALMLGNLYSVGTRLVTADETLAIKYLNMSAQAHNAAAAGQLGYLLAKQYHRVRRFPPSHIRRSEQVRDAAAAERSSIERQRRRRGLGGLHQRTTSSTSSSTASSTTTSTTTTTTTANTRGSIAAGSISWIPVDTVSGPATAVSAAATMSARAYDYALNGIDAEDVLELLQFAARKGDANGIVGLGYAYYMGVGTEPNITKAMEQFHGMLPAHVDAGFYLGEIYMGQQGPSGDSKYYKLRTPADAGYVEHNSASSAFPDSGSATHSRAIETVSQSGKKQGLEGFRPMAHIDVNSAVRCYSMAAQLGNVLAQHRLAHITARGMGVQVRNCAAAAQGFKAVAERGQWMQDLSVAHAHYAESNFRTALHIFSQLATVGVEAAQYNAAYILSTCTATSQQQDCPLPDRTLPLIVAQEDADTDIRRRRTPKISKATATDTTTASANADTSGKQDQKNSRQSASEQMKKARFFDPLAQDGGDGFGGASGLIVEEGLDYETCFHNIVAHHTGLVLSSAAGAHADADSTHDKPLMDAAPPSAAFLPLEKWLKFLLRYEPSAVPESLQQALPGSLLNNLTLNSSGISGNGISGGSRSGGGGYSRSVRAEECEVRALLLFDLSASQGNADAYVQLGDMYYYNRAGIAKPVEPISTVMGENIQNGATSASAGGGNDNGDADARAVPTSVVNTVNVDYQGLEKLSAAGNVSNNADSSGSSGGGSSKKREAAQFYQKAADMRHTQAIFNLGIMHEIGDGVSQDFHLAKRYYDQAAEVDHKARLPRDLALLMLEGHKSLLEWFGPDAADKMLSMSVKFPGIGPFPIPSWIPLPSVLKRTQQPISLEIPAAEINIQSVVRLVLRTDSTIRMWLDALCLWYEQNVTRSFRHMGVIVNYFAGGDPPGDSRLSRRRSSVNSGGSAAEDGDGDANGGSASIVAGLGRLFDVRWWLGDVRGAAGFQAALEGVAVDGAAAAQLAAERERWLQHQQAIQRQQHPMTVALQFFIRSLQWVEDVTMVQLPQLVSSHVRAAFSQSYLRTHSAFVRAIGKPVAKVSSGSGSSSSSSSSTSAATASKRVGRHTTQTQQHRQQQQQEQTTTTETVVLFSIEEFIAITLLSFLFLAILLIRLMRSQVLHRVDILVPPDAAGQ